MATDKVSRSLASDKKIDRDYQSVTRNAGPSKAKRSPSKGYQGLLRAEYHDFDYTHKRQGRGKKKRSGGRGGRKGSR